MNADRTLKTITTLEATLANDVDVLSDAQKVSIEATIARLRAGLAGAAPMPTSADKARASRAPVVRALAVDDVVTVDAAVTMNPVVDGNVIDVDTVDARRDALTPAYVTAGKATFTVSNPAGVRHTFRVERPDKFRGEYFASVMNGSDNESSYLYVGMSSDRGVLRMTRGSKVPAGDVRAKVLAWALDVVFGRKTLPAGYAIEHAGLCGRCGRLLTVPDSIRTGIGPECARIMGVAA